MADVELRHSTAADRQLKLTALPAGHLGSTSDEGEFFVGNAATPIGLAVTAPQSPMGGVDSRRLFNVGSQGQSDTWEDVDGADQDGSGMVISPRPAAVAGGGTDIITTGYILPYELADGGTITIEATGTYKCGSVMPMILAKLRIAPPGSAGYVAPQYERALNSGGTAAAPFDVTGMVADAFEWSSRTVGLNALGGYEALHISAANLTPGEFQWRLTMKVHALGRWAKWQRFNNSGTNASSTKDRNCWVEATLEWGALSYNGGCRIGEGFGYGHPISPLSTQYNATLPAGVVRGTVYTFLGRQWLCHAGSTTTALNAAADPDTITAATWTQMLSEEAPGMGAHWKELFVPLVSTATISGYATVDWTAGNEVQLELGGPQQVDQATVFPAYNASAAYLAEFGTCSEDGINYVAKTVLFSNNFPRFVAGVSDTTGVTPTFTAGPTGAANSNRCWRRLPATLRDDMRVQHVHGYLYGRRNGIAERRLG
jgi:hypothetical protein